MKLSIDTLKAVKRLSAETSHASLPIARRVRRSEIDLQNAPLYLGAPERAADLEMALDDSEHGPAPDPA